MLFSKYMIPDVCQGFWQVLAEAVDRMIHRRSSVSE